MPKLIIASCCTNAQDGMVVQNITSPEKLLETRKGIVEMLLINHPLDCPIWDQAGECDLQNFAFDLTAARASTRYEFERRKFDPIDIGPYKITVAHDTLHTLLPLCTYVADQLTDHRIHGILWRGDNSEISTYIQKRN